MLTVLYRSSDVPDMHVDNAWLLDTIRRSMSTAATPHTYTHSPAHPLPNNTLPNNTLLPTNQQTNKQQVRRRPPACWRTQGLQEQGKECAGVSRVLRAGGMFMRWKLGAKHASLSLRVSVLVKVSRQPSTVLRSHICTYICCCVVQEAHEAIRPSNPALTPDQVRGLTPDQVRSTKMIFGLLSP